MQSVSELAASLVHVGQALKTLPEHDVHPISLSTFDRVGEEGQRRLMATFGEVHPSGQRQAQPADRRGRGGAHRTAQQGPYFLHGGVASTAIQQGERYLEHQPRAHLAAVMLRIGQTSQQVAAFPSFRLGHCARFAAAVTCRIHRPDCSPQQQSGVVVETRVLAVKLVSLVEGRGSQIISAERGRRLGHGDEGTGPEHWSNIIAGGEHRPYRTERGSGFT